MRTNLRDKHVATASFPDMCYTLSFFASSQSEGKARAAASRRVGGFPPQLLLAALPVVRAGWRADRENKGSETTMSALYHMLKPRTGQLL